MEDKLNIWLVVDEKRNQLCMARWTTLNAINGSDNALRMYQTCVADNIHTCLRWYL